MPHLALLGDSVLDNGIYARPSPDTAELLRRSLGEGWTVALHAQDGSRMRDVLGQLGGLVDPPDVTVLSAGGNDAVDHVGIMYPRSAVNVAVMEELHGIADAFGRTYQGVVEAVAARTSRLIVCTVYEPPLADPDTARLVRVPLSLLNDQIVRAAVRTGCDVLDLRAVFSEPSDFVLEIEPSAAGAGKLAAAIARQVDSAGSHPVGSRIFGA